MSVKTLADMLMRRMPHCMAALGALVLVGCCPRVSMVDVGPLARQEARASLVTAHRARLHHRTFPDNSLPALYRAAHEGIPLLEVDLRRSVEGELFLFHDGSVQAGNSYAPRTLINRSIQTLTRAEREQIFLDANQTVRIPTLDEALTVVANTTSALQLDCKGESDQLVLQALELVARRGLLSKVVVQIRTPARIALVKGYYPRARVLARCRSIEDVRLAISSGAEIVELERWISSEAVRVAHSHGVLVLINLAGSRLDEEDTWAYLRSRGVDIILSDSGDMHSLLTN